MSEIPMRVLKKKIAEILEVADLTVVTSKAVRTKLEERLGCSLLGRKKQIDDAVLEEINKKRIENESSEEEEEEEDVPTTRVPVRRESPSEDEEEKPKTRRAATVRKAPASRKRKSVNGTGSNSDSDDGADEDYEQTKKSAAKKSKAAGGSKRITGFTRPYNLSPELSALMGADSLPRHEVVKKIWSIVKERNLYDPSNKQFAICDDQLMKVMKIKRFRTFGMLKYLKPHFIN